MAKTKTKLLANFVSIISLIASSNSSNEGFTAFIVNGIRWAKANIIDGMLTQMKRKRSDTIKAIKGQVWFIHWIDCFFFSMLKNFSYGH